VARDLGCVAAQLFNFRGHLLLREETLNLGNSYRSREGLSIATVRNFHLSKHGLRLLVSRYLFS
jgi:hypothetical protein